jgi:hypothetical protein
MFSSSVFAQVDGPILKEDNTSEYKTIELINMDKDLDLCKLVDAFWTEYFFGAYHRAPYT